MRAHLPLFVLLGPLGLGLAACQSTGDTPATDAGADVDTRPPTPPEWDRAVTRPSDQAAADGRTACTFAAGSMPAETLGTSMPVDKDIPIDNVVVVMMENHSFDNYFAGFAKYAGRADVEVPPPNASNPEKTGSTPGATVPLVHAPHLCTSDVNHEWAGTHLQYDDGKMDGFVESNEKGMPLGAGARAMITYDERDLPFYYGLAKSFALADHYHSSLLGPTWPNRMFLVSGTSFGLTFNGFPDLSTYTFPEKDASVLDELDKRHVSFGLYGAGTTGVAVVYNVGFISRWGRSVKFTDTEFLDAAKAGKLPQVSFVDAHIGAEGPAQNDEHPPADIQVGQAFVRSIVQAVMTGPQWAHTALFLTWDEHGGYYDHFPPPKACKPDSNAPRYEPNDTTGGDFDRLGIRVPLLVVSPYAKPGYVGHVTYDHTSILRFIQAKFKVPALTARDANAVPPFDMFDFTSPKLLTPPTLPDAPIDSTELDYCKATYAK